jgi:hypothetical protein
MRHVCLFLYTEARAVSVLGSDRFVNCKRKINRVVDFYRPLEVEDPNKTNYSLIKYGVLKDKVDDFIKAVTEIAQTIRNAMAEA